jgi:hypothetical protein
MTDTFRAEVDRNIEPLLSELGFVLEEVDDGPDEGGIPRHIAYFKSADCRLQIYDSSREGEVNCMIAPLDAPNTFGLNTDKWHFISRFSKRADLPPKERLQVAVAEARAYANPFEWVRDRIAKHYETAHTSILELYPSG